MQKLAWERHGFRAANFAGTDSISRFGVAGTLDQIPAVSELPNNDAMQHLITTLQSAQAKLVADISMYDTMYTQNAQQYRELKMTYWPARRRSPTSTPTSCQRWRPRPPPVATPCRRKC